MALLDILTYPDEKLRKKAEPVAEVNDEIRKLIDDMAETMYDAPGIGLAANQVGVLKRVVVIDPEYSDGKPHLYAFVNPEIVSRQGKQVYEEGCLSLPEVREEVERSQSVVVRALGRDGQPFELAAEDLLATVVQHEIDHLDGMLFIDHLSFLKRRMLSRDLTKRKRAG
jgi:peptide deformylase